MGLVSLENHPPPFLPNPSLRSPVISRAGTYRPGPSRIASHRSRILPDTNNKIPWRAISNPAHSQDDYLRGVVVSRDTSLLSPTMPRHAPPCKTKPRSTDISRTQLGSICVGMDGGGRIYGSLPESHSMSLLQSPTYLRHSTKPSW